jgi:hypothetical protein
MIMPPVSRHGVQTFFRSLQIDVKEVQHDG